MPDADSDARLRLVVNVGDRWLRAVAGDFCLKVEGGSGCGDAVYDVDELPRIRIGPRETLVVRPEAAASRVRVNWGRLAYQDDGRVEARRADDGGRRWRVRLPKRARKARYLRIHVEYGSRFEWADFYVGVRFA